MNQRTNVALHEQAALLGEHRPAAHSRLVSSTAECVSCSVESGFPVTDGSTWSYYLARGDGRRMLVLSRRLGQRVRLNGKIDLVVVGHRDGEVQLGIEQSPDTEG
jgi:hypothetical protein